ncbi:MAG: PrsW family intramembrane metalloprotease [Chloroflexia bacterium]
MSESVSVRPYEAEEQVTHVCCVCGKPVSPPYNLVAGRIFCDRHLAAMNKPHPGFWRAAVVQLVVTGLFAVAVMLIAPYIGRLDGALSVIVGLGLVLVPTVLWMVYFYRQDLREPEPKTRILQVFGLALLLAEAVGFRLVNEWFNVPEWASSLNWTSLLASVLIAGFTWQGITYVAVRAVVYATPEFDERIDGLVYGTIAGLGVATLINLHYVLDNMGVALGAGVVFIVTTALIQASFSGVTGYFMARGKFEHKPVWYVPLGVTLAAVLDGLFTWLINEVSADGLTVAPWRSLVVGLLVGAVAFGVLLMLLRPTERPLEHGSAVPAGGAE